MKGIPQIDRNALDLFSTGISAKTQKPFDIRLQ
jgi:hypothetical protein